MDRSWGAASGAALRRRPGTASRSGGQAALADRVVSVSEIRVSRPRPDVAVVTIDRPARRNACNLVAWQGLARNFGELAQDRTVRLAILTGAAGHFCAGADI